jgi:hypothetical protein
MIIPIVLGGIVVMIIIICLIWYFNKQRVKALKQLAESLNFTFSEKGDKSVIDTLGKYHLFSQGYSRRISNVLTGKFNTIPVTVMEYQYTTGSGKSAHTWRQTVLVVESDKLRLPRFVLRPENLFDKIGSMFGTKDINFETAPAFSKRYLLRGDDEESVRQLFNERVTDHYEQHPGLSTEGDGRKLIYYRISKKVSPDQIQTFLQEGYDIFDLFKNY